MYAVSYFQVCGSRMLWVVSYLLLHVEPMWNIITKSEIQISEQQVYIMMFLTKDCLYFLNRQAVGIFKVLIITKLSNIFESLTVIGIQFNYYLSFSFYHSLCTESSTICPHIFIFINIVIYIYRVHFGKRK